MNDSIFLYFINCEVGLHGHFVWVSGYLAQNKDTFLGGAPVIKKKTKNIFQAIHFILEIQISPGLFSNMRKYNYHTSKG